ncbi:cytidylyltransferase domain-containing protein [Tenacibaculum xiamenense]|uniref:cytidylyltransferase domain-containing protein n=1 Tax=Tenacibaculum xiamenense TaxID=1261553 RepID=UPI003893D080
MSLGIVIQARLASTRLPNKIVLPIDGEVCFLEILLDRIKEHFNKIPIILATSTNKENDLLEKYANKFGVEFFRGEEQNVLKRFVDCSEEYDLKTIIRVCSDNPFLDINHLKMLIDQYNGEDYFSFAINGKPSILTHYGFFSEIVSSKSLKKVLNSSINNCFEHVTNCIYSNQEKFNVRFVEKNIENKNIRCTLDTKQDFENLQKIHFEWYRNNRDKSLESLISFIEKNSEIEEKMKNQIETNRK